MRGELGAPYPFAFNTCTGETMSRVAWYQPGYLLHDDAPASAADEVDRYLLAARSGTSSELYYYGEESFTAGDGYYAGINLMPDHLSGMMVDVTIGGTESLDVVLNEGSKFYIRGPGYTGTLDCTLGADAELELYPDPECGGQGYQIALTSFGQAYLDNQSEGYDTKIDGQIDLPYPAGIDIPFEDMTLDPCGNFTDGKIPEDELTETRTLDYWLADLRLSTVGFERREGGDTYDMTLWVSTVNTVEGLGDEPLMQLNFRPCGLYRRILGGRTGRYDHRRLRNHAGDAVSHNLVRGRIPQRLLLIRQLHRCPVLRFAARAQPDPALIPPSGGRLALG